MIRDGFGRYPVHLCGEFLFWKKNSESLNFVSFVFFVAN